MFRIFKHKFVIFCLVLILALAVYFFTLRPQGEVGKIAINLKGENPLLVIPAKEDGSVAWIEAIYVTDVPTNTPIPTFTPTIDKSKRATKTPTITPTATENIQKTSKAKKPTSTPTFTPEPSATPTTHASFTGFNGSASLYNTFGSSNSADSIIIRDRLYLLIADGEHGLQIVDATDPNRPSTTKYLLDEAYAVKINGTKAYIAAGEDGIVVLDISKPLTPVAVDKRRTIGPAINLDISTLTRKMKDPATGFEVPYTITRIYVAMGEDGFQVINLYPINTHHESITTKNKSIVNKSYTKTQWLKSGNETFAVIGARQSSDGEVVIIADGKNGVQILYLPDNVHRPIKSESVIRHINIPNAWDVAYGRLLQHRNKNDKEIPWLIVAAGKDGVFTYKVDFGDDPTKPVFSTHQLINTPGEARGVTLYHNNVFVGDGEGGLQVIDFNDPNNPKLLGNGRFEFAWTHVPIIYALREWLWKNVESPGAQSTVWFVLLDGLLCTSALVIMAFVLVGYILPVRTMRERWGVIRRLVANLLNRHGPVRIIEDGRVRYHTPPEQRHGLGITLQDPNSAVLLDQHRDPRRASGAQLILTGTDEHIIWQAELRRKQLIIGPKETDPDPFQMRGEVEERAEYRARQFRRQTTAGRTSDGIEVVPTIRIIYSLQGSDPSERDEFGYAPEAVIQAFQGDHPKPKSDRSGLKSRHRQPQPVQQKLERLLSGLWKLMLSKYSLVELFPPTSIQNPLNVINAICTDLSDLLVKHQIGILEQFHDAGDIATLQKDFHELFGRIHPQSRDGRTDSELGHGIQVHEVSIDALYLAEDDLQQILWKWYDDWKAGGQSKLVDLESKNANETLICFTEYAIQFLQQIPDRLPFNQRLAGSLACLLRGTQMACAPDSQEYKRLEIAIRQLGGCPK